MMFALPLDPSFTMSELDFRSLHQVYATWRGRVPAAQPRNVHVSRELFNNPDRAHYSAGLSHVLREVAQGDSLRPRMSTLIEHAYTPRTHPLLTRKRHRRQPEVDRLLGDWGLHHLHVYSEPHRSRPGFTRRSPHVLFAAFTSRDAYLIDLVAHETEGANWAALAILEVIVNNWPEAGILLPSLTALRLKDDNWSDEDRRNLRAAGIATGAVEIGGQVWAAGLGGQSLSGVPARVSQHCMHVRWQLMGYQPTEEEVRTELAAMASKHGVPNEWRGHVEGERFGYFSEGVFAEYGSLLPS